MSQMLELRRLVREWAEPGLAYRPSKLPSDEGATLAYIDLFFAFGLARLGEGEPARRLVESASQMLARSGTGEDRKLATGFLFRAFRYRVEQALAGQPHAGPLSAELLGELEAWRAHKFPISPEGLAHYVVQRMRERSRILEPDERIDVYAGFMRSADERAQAVASLSRIDDPVALAQTIRELYHPPGREEPDPEFRYRLLVEALPLATRVGESFAVELLALVRDVLGTMGHAKVNPYDLVGRQGEWLERALALAVRFDRRESVRDLAGRLVELLGGKSEKLRPELARRAVGPVLRGVRACGLGSEIETLVTRLDGVLMAGRSLDAVRRGYHGRSDRKGMVLEGLLGLAGGWLMLGRPEAAGPILDEARTELTGPDPSPLHPDAYVSLARAYIAALGHGPADTGLPRVMELFRGMNPARVTNSFTTCRFFSRFHLVVAEEAVFAACRLLGGSEVRPVMV